MKQSGNALFLILIAVALFAALSYAVTQSGRGGGSIDRETEEIGLAQLMQEIGRVQNAFDRMSLLGTPADQIEFCVPANITRSCFSSGTGADALCSTGSNCLFSAEGGGLTSLNLIAESLINPARGNIWTFREVSNATTTLGHGTAAADIIFEHDGISLDACEALNTKLELSVPLVQDPNGGDVGGDSGAYIHCYEFFNGAIWLPKVMIILKAN